MLKLVKDRKGYLLVGLHKKGKAILFLVHRLVAIMFIPNLEHKEQVNHINGTKTDNREENLEWCTNGENGKHAYKIGLKKTKAVLQYDLQGNFIKEWNSIKEAVEYLNINYSNIPQCCRGKRKTTGGYRWQYKDTQ